MARRWTDKEIEVLHDYSGILDYKELSKRLHRSCKAIKLYRCRHKMPTFFDNFYTYTMLSKELGLSRATLRKYYKRRWLEGRLATWTWAYGKTPMIFQEDNITKFLKEKYHLFKDRFIPNPYFRNLVRELNEIH